MSDWKMLKLNEVFKIARGGSPRPIKDFLTDSLDGINWIKIGDTKNVQKYIYETKEKIKKEGIKKSLIVKENDFILSNSMSFGRPYIMKTKGCIHDGWLLMRSKKENTSIDFMYYVLSSEEVKKQFSSRASGSTVQNLNIKLVETVNVPFPPFLEQQKIANILSTVDAKLENIAQQIQTTEQLKKGLMQQLLSGKYNVLENRPYTNEELKDSPLGRVSKEWEVVKIETLLNENRIISHLDGNHGGLYPKSHEFSNEGTPYISANSFLNNKVNFNKCKRLPLNRALKFKKGIAKNGDILFAHNATVGPVAFLKTELDFVILSTTATYYRLDNKTIYNRYWLYFLDSFYFKQQYQKVMGQSTRNQVPITTQRKFYSILPNFKEQQKIATILSAVDTKIEQLLTKKDYYTQLKKGLMQQLLTGKIRVKV
ncbi:restriction endonuclease subunit S [uncultured Tenacibaculum sp.]|uniref:restriction endonuclease subunit S n=1 Tax=uncultured Tenacibaculum sp. TaxID=174713 RepID=UPI002615D480|nr:restriction endonuclease subunit S [uncultured Tenacibaculum sp.]